eukprot:COSAG06_NODE_997_length_11148_cov_5.400489_10_plen_46_part_00
MMSRSERGRACIAIGCDQEVLTLDDCVCRPMECAGHDEADQRVAD